MRWAGFAGVGTWANFAAFQTPLEHIHVSFGRYYSKKEKRNPPNYAAADGFANFSTFEIDGAPALSMLPTLKSFTYTCGNGFDSYQSNIDMQLAASKRARAGARGTRRIRARGSISARDFDLTSCRLH